MTLPTASRPQGHSNPTRIGQARPSHLVTTMGVGAVTDLPAMSVVVRGLDAWSPERQEVIDEPRLLDEVRRVLNQPVRALRSAPWDPQEADDPWTRVGVPVSPFPRWVRCPACHRLGPLDPPGQFELVHRFGRRPDLAKFVHAHCTRQSRRADRNKRACVPARFLVVCEDGHLDDFPYVEFVHSGRSERPCGGPKLTVSDAGSTLGPRVTVRCAECGAARSIADAAGREGSAALPRCRGRHPHLQRFEACDNPLRLMVLGASNLWFSVTASALHLPRGRGLRDQVAVAWEILGAQPTPEVAKAIIDGMDQLRALRGHPIDDVWAAIEQIRGAGGPQPETTSDDLLEAEWDLLSHPTTDREDEDFRAVPAARPSSYEGLLEQVVQVRRLREVQALIGFTRLNAPERRELEPDHRVPLARGALDWVPAVEQRGEGIFLELREAAVAAWATRVADHPRFLALRDAGVRNAANRDRTYDRSFPLPRYLLLHVLSHVLLRQVALECGYSSASLRERIYVGRPDRPAAGILLSTAASDSEGTLGGLVALGEARFLGRLLDDALVAARRCSSDPLCAEHVPADPSDTLHAAACHACLFASETSCETNNRWLDRAALVDLTGDGLAFLS
jgi:hypothetical protein